MSASELRQLLVPVSSNRNIPPSIRRAVIERDGMVCRYCGHPVVRVSALASYRPDGLHLDHVQPWATGGEHTLENLVVSCADCNLGRPRPTAKDVVRQARIRITIRDGEYWWPSDYTPARVTGLAGGHLVTLDRLAWMTSKTPVAIIQRIDRGDLVSTNRRYPIRVQVPPVLRSESVQRFLEDVAAEEAREARAREVEAERQAELREARSRAWLDELGPVVPPDPERVAYWQGVIDEGRAKRRAARLSEREAV